MASSSSSTGSFEVKWTVNTCTEIAKRDFFPLLVKDIDIQKTIITRFIDFYSGGRKKQGLTVTDLIFAVISIMPQHEETEEFIWDAKQYSESGTLFSVTPRDKDKQNDNVQEDTNVSDNIKNICEPMLAKADERKNQGNEKQVNPITKVQNSEEIKNLMESPDLKNLEDIKSTNIETYVEEDYFESFENRTQKKTIFDGGRDTTPEIPVFSSFNWGYNKTRPQQNDNEENTPHYGPIENHAFHISCNKLLDEWHTSNVARITLKYFFGIIALFLMRGTTKKDKHLKKTFAAPKMLTVASFSIDLKYFIPHNRCLRNSYKTLRKRDGKIPVMFAKIILNSSRIDALLRTKPKLNYPKLNIFRFAVLSHTAGFGFGLISMLQNLETKLSIVGFNNLVKATFCDLTAQSWNILHDFIINYKENGKDVTHNWARVISNDYFRNLSCPENLALSVILGVFIEEITKSPDIWRSAWAQNAENINDLKKLGSEMCRSFKVQSESQAQFKPPNAKDPLKNFFLSDFDINNLSGFDEVNCFDHIENDFSDSGHFGEFDYLENIYGEN